MDINFIMHHMCKLLSVVLCSNFKSPAKKEKKFKSYWNLEITSHHIVLLQFGYGM